MNVDVSKLSPGVFGVSHGSGPLGMIIRDATGSWAGHAFLYLGAGQIVEGTAPVARLAAADSHQDAIWAWRMWEQLQAGGWTPGQVAAAQAKVVARGRAEVGTKYDYLAYLAFAAEVIGLRTEHELAPEFTRDHDRVCSALVDDAETTGGVPMSYVPEDGPGLRRDSNIKVSMPPNLVTPGMLLGLAQRLDWT